MSILQLILLFLFISSSCVCSYSNNDVKSWCSQTPYPQPCEYFLTSKSFNKPIKQKSHFLKISLQLALERAQLGALKTLSLGSKCRNPSEKAAWEDCLDLYDHTIHKLNKTLNPTIKLTRTDAQTWLSTALTNLETCILGFYDLKVVDYVLPLMNNNVTKLLSNVLSLNKGPYELTPSFKDEFPSWLKPGDRKLLQVVGTTPNAVVAKDGSGKYKTLKEAVDDAPKSSKERYVIYVKAGVYNEQVEIKGNNIMLVGDGIGKTIITGSKSVGGGTTTFRSATVAASGDGFIARDISFRNTAGATKHQAVAFRSSSDHSVFFRCSFEGYQDTLYVHSDRQFYKQCDVYGTVDFIFGNAAVVLQDCNLYARTPPQGTITFTAQGRTDPNQNTGIVVHRCTVAGGPGFEGAGVKAYLGRPWKMYSRTVYLNSSIGGLIEAEGWMEWNGDFALDTLYYAEYGNIGVGASTARRVKWKGFHVIGASEASQFSVATFLSGNSWLPGTSVPFTAGL